MPVLWIALLAVCVSLGHVPRKRSECAQGFQPWHFGCVSNERYIRENLAGER